MNQPDERPYNFIYSTLVDGDNDVLGAIAYSVYKRQKIETIKEFENKHKRSPTDTDLSQFRDFSNSPSQLQFYRGEALQLVQLFVDETLSESIENEVSKGVSEQLASSKPSFMYGVAQSLVASILFVVFVGLIFFFSSAYRMGVEGAIESFWSVKIEHTQMETGSDDL